MILAAIMGGTRAEGAEARQDLAVGKNMTIATI